MGRRFDPEEVGLMSVGRALLITVATPLGGLIGS